MTRAPLCGAGTARRRPSLLPWALGALAIAIALLAAVWIVAHLVTPDPSGYLVAGVNEPADLGAVGHVLFRNSLVLALHAMACVAGFIAGSSLPMQAENHRGWWRTVHEKAGPAAIVFVAAATTFSLCTQGYVLGSGAATLAAQLDVGRTALMLTLLPHALLELVALFLPLAAWMLASRREAWNELLAATAVTTAIAVPMLILAASLEVFVWPRCCGSPRRSGRSGASSGRRPLCHCVTTLCIVTGQTASTRPGDNMAANIIEVTDASFQAEVIESETPVLVDFWAPWCGPCRVVAPVLEEIAQERDDLRIVKLNVDENQVTAAQYQVLSIPTLIIFKDGAEAKKVIGAYPKKRLEAEIEPVLA